MKKRYGSAGSLGRWGTGSNPAASERRGSFPPQDAHHRFRGPDSRAVLVRRTGLYSRLPFCGLAICDKVASGVFKTPLSLATEHVPKNCSVECIA